MTPLSDRLWRQYAKRLLIKQTRICPDNLVPGIKCSRVNKDDKNIVFVPMLVLQEWSRLDLISENPSGGWIVTETGIANLRRMAGGFQAQHQIQIRHKNDEGVVTIRNASETALDWLVNRKGGRFTLTKEELDAAYRLRDDYERAHMTSRLTMDWTQAGYEGEKGQRRAGGHEVLPNSALDARKRVSKALNYVGPILSDMLVEICCYQSGLQESEERLGVPARSAKLLLKSGLARLSVHYGFQTEIAVSASLRMR